MGFDEQSIYYYYNETMKLWNSLAVVYRWLENLPIVQRYGRNDCRTFTRTGTGQGVSLNRLPRILNSDLNADFDAGALVDIGLGGVEKV